MDGGAYSNYRVKFTLKRCKIDTTGYAAAVTGLIRTNGTIDIEIGDLDIYGTNYNAVIAVTSPVDVTVKITQNDQRREIVSGVYNTSGTVVVTYTDPKNVLITAPVGNVGTGTDPLQSYTLPSRSMNENQDQLDIVAAGTYANNANAKTVALAFGTENIVSQTLTVSAAGSWRIDAKVTCAGLNFGGVINGATRTSNVTVFSLTTIHPVRVGDSFIIAGLDTGFNGTFVATAIGANTVTAANAGADGSSVDTSGTIAAYFQKAVYTFIDSNSAVSPLTGIVLLNQVPTATTVIRGLGTASADNDIVQQLLTVGLKKGAD